MTAYVFLFAAGDPGTGQEPAEQVAGGRRAVRRRAR